MITAIVMINCRIDSIPEAAQTIAEIKAARQVYSVTGDAALIAVLNLRQYDDLASVVTEGIAKVEGVESIRTHLAFRTYSTEQLEEAFHLGLD